MYKKNNTKKFDKDLEWGVFWEFETISFIENLFNEHLNPKGMKLMFLNENLNKNVIVLKDWDVKYVILDTLTNVKIKTITFEIKADKFEETGNLFFEKSCSKKQSGVFTTKANFFVYYLPRYKENNFYIVKPEKLINLINDKFPSCINYGGGDNGRVVSYLINKNTFDDEYKSINCGKLLTCNLTIPEKFGIDKFDEKKKYTYYSDTKKNYDDDFL